jgi:hypothetical protein
MRMFGFDQDEFKKFKSDVQNKIETLRKSVDGLKPDVQSQIEALRNNIESFKPDIQGKIDTLHGAIQLKVTDSEETARVAASNAVDSEQKIKTIETNVFDALKTLEDYRDGAKDELVKIQAERANVQEKNASLLGIIEENNKLHAEVLEAKESIVSATSTVSENIGLINIALANSQMLPEQVANITKLLEETTALDENMKDLLSHSMKKKSEIDDLYKKIIGHDIKVDEGESEHIDGLRDELEKSYESIKTKADGLDVQIEGLVNSVIEKQKTELGLQQKAFEKLVLDSNNRITAVNEQLTGLLPGAMAEGLSAAYEKKKDDEILSLDKFEFTFQVAIALMVVVSLIPFGVDVYLLGWKGDELVQVIKNTPSLVIAILPLYLPVLWLAYSSNKKLNLSKRLIEEYTHKAVLGKTFSGLSNQIETLPRESAVRDELRTRLLFNLLQVSSENPGKLITNYNTSDHPLMDVLENSAKLSDTVEALSKIPGLSAITKVLNARKDEMLKNEAVKVEKGIAVQEVLESNV